MSAASRDNRVLHYAVLFSIIVHGLALLSAPRLNFVSKRVETWPAPIAARLVAPPPAPEPAPPTREPASEPVVRPLPPKPVAKPQPAPAKATPQPPAPAPASAPAPEPSPAPAPQAAEAPRPAAPAPRPGIEIDADTVARFRLQVIQEAARHKRYPRMAQDNNWQGRTGVRVSFGADGRRSAVAVVRSSGYEVLDRQALDTVTRADVPVPAGLRGKAFAIEFDVVYDLKDSS